MLIIYINIDFSPLEAEPHIAVRLLVLYKSIQRVKGNFLISRSVLVSFAPFFRFYVGEHVGTVSVHC